MQTINLIDTAKEVLDIEAKAILRTKENLDEVQLNNAIDAIYNSKGRVIITGMGKSGQIGKKLQRLCLQQELQLTTCTQQKVRTVILG